MFCSSQFVLVRSEITNLQHKFTLIEAGHDRYTTPIIPSEQSIQNNANLVAQLATPGDQKVYSGSADNGAPLNGAQQDRKREGNAKLTPAKPSTIYSANAGRSRSVGPFRTVCEGSRRHQAFPHRPCGDFPR
jgi:hypothetical protein